MMETTEQINHNGVYGTSVHNGRASPGSQVQPGQGPGGRHQATDPMRRQEQAAEGNPTEARQRKRWSRNENKEAWRCYIMSNPEVRGYRKRMYNIWNERDNTPLTEQRLADQVNNIKKTKWLSEQEREEIERLLIPNVIMVDQVDHEPIENHEEVEAPNNDNILPEVMANEAPVNMEYVNKLTEWMQIEEKSKLPSLKAYDKRS